MMLDTLAARTLCGFTRALTGARVLWLGCAPDATQRVYFGNHGSHGDFALIWACLPYELRTRTRPVAGADYWCSGALRKYVAEHLINAVLIDRNRATRTQDPILQMAAAIGNGDSLIVFPEGTRNTTEATLLPFKTGDGRRPAGKRGAHRPNVAALLAVALLAAVAIIGFRLVTGGSGHSPAGPGWQVP